MQAPKDSVSFMSMLLTPQRQLIEGRFDGFPESAEDDYCLGYIVGTVDVAMNVIQDNKYEPVDLIIMALMIAYGDGETVGAREQRLVGRITDLAGAYPPEYLQGKNDAFEGAKEFIRAAQSGMPMPATHWFDYVKDKAIGFNTVDEAVEALAQAKRVSIEDARNTVLERIEAATVEYQNQGRDSFISKLAAEEEVREQIAREIADA